MIKLIKTPKKEVNNGKAKEKKSLAEEKNHLKESH